MSEIHALTSELEDATTPSSTSLEDVDQFLKNHGPDEWFEEALKLSLIKANATVVTYLTTYGDVFIFDKDTRQKIYNKCLIYGVIINAIVVITLMADACDVVTINRALNKALSMGNRERISELLQNKINAIIKGTNYAITHIHRSMTCSKNPNVSCQSKLMFTVQKPVEIYPLNPLYPSNS